ncbi:MAG: hypothetical protein HYZ92_00665 [Candidatus Omnitrophica bacterium]|nr:hypothetical protein [Candidatus Omnitrophota bacterium]
MEQGCAWGYAAASRPCRQTEAALQVVVDPLGEDEGIEARAALTPGGARARIGLRTVGDAIQRRLRRVVAPGPVGADPALLRELHRGLEAMPAQPEVSLVEPVARRTGRRGVVALPGEALASVRPGLLLAVGGVVLLVGPAAGDLPRLALRRPPARGVEALAAGVRVDPAAGAGPVPAPVLERRLEARRSLAEPRARLGSRRVEVGQRVDEVPGSTVARARDAVDLGGAGRRHSPGVGLDGDGLRAQGSRRGAAIQPRRLCRFFACSRRSICRALIVRTWCAQGGGQREAWTDPGEPDRQQRLQPHRPGGARRVPHLREDREGRRAGGGGPLAPPPGRGRRRPGEPPDRVLALVATHLAALAQDAGLLDWRRSLIAGVEGARGLPCGASAHAATLLVSGDSFEGATLPSRVTF